MRPSTYPVSPAAGAWAVAVAANSRPIRVSRKGVSLRRPRTSDALTSASYTGRLQHGASGRSEVHPTRGPEHLDQMHPTHGPEHQEKRSPRGGAPTLVSLVPKVGLEPTQPRGHTTLNRARLPIPPLRQGGRHRSPGALRCRGSAAFRPRPSTKSTTGSGGCASRCRRPDPGFQSTGGNGPAA